MKENTFKHHVLRFTLLLFIVGCTSTSPLEESPNPVPTHTLLPKLTVTPTLIFTVPPTLLEMTPINTATIEERRNFFKQSMSHNGDCRLPCWWEISPGDTLDEAKRTIHVLGGKAEALRPGYDPEATFYGTSVIDWMDDVGMPISNNIDFEEKQGLIYAWHISSTGFDDPEEFRRVWENYSAQKIVTAYGMPDRILLWVVPSPDSLRYGGYSQWLFYDEFGFSIRYDGRIPKHFSGAPFFRICSSDPLLAIELDIQSPDNPLPLDRFDKILEDIRLGTDTGKLRIVYSLQDATGLDDIEIYNTFTQDEAACFAVPSDIWRQ